MSEMRKDKDVHLTGVGGGYPAASQEMISCFVSLTPIIYVTNVEERSRRGCPENDRRMDFIGPPGKTDLKNYKNHREGNEHEGLKRN